MSHWRCGVGLSHVSIGEGCGDRDLSLRGLTQLVEVRVDPVGSRDGTDQTGLAERAPPVHQHPLASQVVLTAHK